MTTTITSYDDAREAVRSGATPAEAARRLVASLTPQEKMWCLDGDMPAIAGLGFLGSGGYHRATAKAAEIARVGFPGIAFSDGPRGCVIGNATCFPVPMARGATWDPDLEQQVGRAIGAELRASGANFTGAVCVNVLRHPAWGRAQETYGEDPLHVGEMGAAFTRGLQEHVMACVKHFACNSMENARFTVDVEVDEVALHEIYLPHFRRIVGEGVAAVMSAYNSLNGEWCSQNRHLLTEILRDEWGFTGMTISDFVFGVRDAAASLRAGLDIEMPARMVRYRNLPAALEAGDITWREVDTAVERTVATLLRFDAVLAADSPPAEVIGSAGHRALARRVASSSIVLLKNEPVGGGAPLLPLAPTTGRLAVLGRLADTVNVGDMGSSDVWDVACATVLDGLRSTFADVVHDPGTDLSAAAALAATSDTCIVVVGYTHADEGEFLGAGMPDMSELFPPEDEPEVEEKFSRAIANLPEPQRPDRVAEAPGGFGSGGDRLSLRLPAADVALIRSVAAANRRTVVAVQTGSAALVSEWIDEVPAALLAWYGGCEAGPALADVITGTEDASGRLPFSLPVAEGDLPHFDARATSFRYDCWHGWWHLARNGTEPSFPFGFGLSYTTFELSDVSVTTAPTRSLVTSGTLRNTGRREGSDVVQVYAELPDPDRPARLVGFQRVSVPAGSTRPFEVAIPLDLLATRDPAAGGWQPARGLHQMIVGRYAGDPGAARIAVDLGDGGSLGDERQEH